MDHRADIYAFGATAYELLAGEPPFANRGVAEQMSAHLVESPISLATRRPQVPLALDALVRACLEKSPAQRPQSAADLLALLDDPAVVSGAVASSATPSMAVPRQRRRAVGRWVALIALLGTVGGAAWLLNRDPGNREPGVAAVVAPAMSVAVFPLVSLSADSADHFVAEGMSEALTNALAGVPGVRVASRRAAAAAQQQGLAPEAVARQLGVSTYIEGTVQRTPERLRVTLRLVNAADGFTVWSDVYDRASTDLLTAQSEIARGVADAVSQGLLEPAAGSATAR
jgi:serine/threonine-protein kinase